MSDLVINTWFRPAENIGGARVDDTNSGDTNCEVIAYLSEIDGAPIFEVSTTEDTGEVRIMLNDATVYAGNPDTDENGAEMFSKFYEAIAACEAPQGTQVDDDVLGEYQSTYERLKEHR